MRALERLTTDTREQRTDGTAVTHDEYASVRAFIEESLDKDTRAGDDLPIRFAALRRGVGVDQDAMVDPGNGWCEFTERMPFEHTETALAQQGISRWYESQYRADDLGRLTRSIEVTREEGLKTQSAQGLCEVSGFLATSWRELRGVVLALDEP